MITVAIPEPSGSAGSCANSAEAVQPDLLQVAIDRFQSDKSDPSVIVVSEIKRCQLPHFTQFFQIAILG